MKIAIVQNVPINDHRMVHTNGIATELTKRGHQVYVIIQKSSEPPQFKNTDYRIVEIQGRTYSIAGQTSFMINLLRHLNRNHYDLLHCKNPFSSLVPCLLRRWASPCKVIYDIRGLWVDFSQHSGDIHPALCGVLKWFDVSLMNRCDAVIAISPELKCILEGRGVKKNLIKVLVGDGVKIPDEAPCNAEDGLVGYIGTISVDRRSDRILEAFSLLIIEMGIKAHLLMVGPVKSREAAYFTRLVEDLGLADDVTFTGFMDHQSALNVLSRLDVAVAFHEGDIPIFNVAVPTKILEYLAYGCCIVASDHMMYRNILTDGQDAILTPQTPEGLATGIRRALQDKDNNSKLRANARRTVENYTIEKQCDSLEKIYSALVSEKTVNGDQMILYDSVPAMVQHASS